MKHNKYIMKIYNRTKSGQNIEHNQYKIKKFRA